jgi:MFS family permease
MTQPEPAPRTSPRLHRNVWVMTAVSFLTDISSEMIVNLIPLFLANLLGAQTAAIGLIEGIAETTASLTKVFSGGLSDRLGKRKALAVLGYGLSTVAKPFLFFANSIVWVLGVRFSDRLGKGIRTAPRDALLAGSIPAEQRGLAFGIQRAGDTAGAFLGLAIAALIIYLTQSSAETLTRSTFQTVVLVSIVPALLGVLVLAFGAVEVTSSGKARAPILSFQGMDRRFLLYLGVVILFTLGNSSDAFIILLGQDRGLSVLQIMLMLMTFNAVYALLAGPAGALSDRIGRRGLILFGWLAYGLIYLGFAFTRTGTAVWVLFGLYGVYYALTEGAAKALIADLVPEARRGTAYGLYAAAIGLSALPASFIGGLLWDRFGPPATFYFGSALALLAGLLFAVLFRGRQPIPKNA